MSEGGPSETPITLPIGFVIDETSLTTAIKEAQRRFSRSMTEASDEVLERSTLIGGFEETTTRLQERTTIIGEDFRNEVALSTSAVENLERTMSRINKLDLIGRVGTEIEGFRQRKQAEIDTLPLPALPPPAADEEEPESRGMDMAIMDISRLFPETIYRTTGLIEGYMRDKALDEINKYTARWLKNWGGRFAEEEPPPFSGAAMEDIAGMGVVAAGGDIGSFFRRLVEATGSEELGDVLQSEESLQQVMAVLGDVDELGRPTFNLLLGIDEVSQSVVESINRVTSVLNEAVQSTLMKNDESYIDMGKTIHELIMKGFTESGKQPGTELFDPRAAFETLMVLREGTADVSDESMLSLNPAALKRLRYMLKRRQMSEELREEMRQQLQEMADVAFAGGRTVVSGDETTPVTVSTTEKGRKKVTDRAYQSILEDFFHESYFDTDIEEGPETVPFGGEAVNRRYLSDIEREFQFGMDKVMEDLVMSGRFGDLPGGRGQANRILRAMRQYYYHRAYILGAGRGIQTILDPSGRFPVTAVGEELPDIEEEMMTGGLMDELDTMMPRGQPPVNIGSLFDNRRERLTDYLGDATAIIAELGDEINEREAFLREFDEPLISNEMLSEMPADVAEGKIKKRRKRRGDPISRRSLELTEGERGELQRLKTLRSMQSITNVLSGLEELKGVTGVGDQVDRLRSDLLSEMREIKDKFGMLIREAWILAGRPDDFTMEPRVSQEELSVEKRRRNKVLKKIDEDTGAG